MPLGDPDESPVASDVVIAGAGLIIQRLPLHIAVGSPGLTHPP